MSQAELASLLDHEQKKSEQAQDTKASAKAPAKSKKAPAKKKAEEKKEDVPSEEKASDAPAKRTKKKAEKKEEAVEEKPAEETKPEEKKTASKAKTSDKKKKTKKDAEEPAAAKEEPVVTAASEEVKEAPSEEKKEETKDTKKRGKKPAKKGKETSEAVEAEAEPKQEEASENKEEASEKPAEENAENAEAKAEAPKENEKQGKKNKKSRHRSVEIRPANEATAPAAEGEESSEKTEQDGENAPENNKPQIEPVEFVGVLEIVQDGGYGFVRRENYLPSPQDVFVPTNLIRRFGLRMGDQIQGFALPKRGQDKNLALSYITKVNEVELDKIGRRPHFERLTPIYPDERFRLETGKQELSTRIIDLVSPIGKGQRGMIVSPPKAGKTILLQKIANAITQNSPKTKLIVLLIDERPEEVTDMQRSIKGEVVYSTFDKKPENHTRVTELVLERAMRLVEMGEDVVILLDSMTRLARAYNLTITPTGRTLSGGLDPGSLYGPKRFFGAARNIENGGSLTIVATSLIETGSRMDEVIFEEFKGTGNMEVYLDRKLSEKRIFPAIDINKSGTRREDLLMSQEELDAVWTIRKAFSQMETAPVTETIINLLLRTNSNDHFIRSVKVSFADKEVFDAMRGTGANGSANGGN
ncbi:MAG: transcription termination factor Rho [Clostridiales bacterium]|nr:transcription termination factor Rho [Clostridiales bacterium]